MSLILEDVQAQIFTQYLKLIQEALEEVNVPELENFWNTSYRLGSRGLVMRTLINQDIPKNDFLQFLTEYYKRKSIQAMKEKDFVSLEEILDKRPDLAFSFVMSFMAVHGGLGGRSREKLSLEELANFLYLVVKAITFIPQRGVELTRRLLNMIARAKSLISAGKSKISDAYGNLMLTEESKELLYLLVGKMTNENWNKQAFQDILLVVKKDEHPKNKLSVFHFLVNALLTASQD